MKPSDTLVPGSVVLLFNILVLFVWQLFSPLHFKRDFDESLDQYGR